MSYCILLLTHLITFQGADLSAFVGGVYPSSGDSIYISSPMLGVSADYTLRNNLAGRFQYSHIWLKSGIPWEYESGNSDEFSGILRVIKPVFNFADLYAFGGGGLWVSPDKETRLNLCYGFGAKKDMSPLVFLELNFRVNHVLDKASPLRNWWSFYGGLGLHLSKKSAAPVFTKRDEAEIIIRYLAPELRKPTDFKSDEEMEKFVEEFWNANDPIPHTPENEFKEEVFPRIEYTNKWFKEEKEGWKTDRGRIWIIWGEPDETMGEYLHLHPTECWVYLRIYKDVTPVVFVFQEYVSVYRQVFSNVPGEFGYNANVELINPSIDQYTQKKW